MKRVQIQLTDDQASAIEQEGRQTSRSSSAVVRDVLDEWMARHERQRKWQRALAAVGGSHSGLTDVSERHDDYLDEDRGA
jgi:hypothetical protein